ncbi:hypothetical protein GCM10027343_19410 [Noviherbaspirillum agri]
MPEEHLINSINKHYLDRVMTLADAADIMATEDIFDARGMKLVAKGTKISPSLQERQLNKPFESSIAIDSGVDISLIASDAKRIIETVEPVRAIVQSIGGQSPVQVLSGIQFGSAMSTMLTLIERGGSSALEHSVMVSLLSICLGKKLGMSSTDQSIVALAGLLHDIGELYIDPQYLHSRNHLYPHEWRHVVVHPRIGQLLVSNLENYPAAVAQAVFEHHERHDGSGYPRQISGSSISAAGQVVATAEMIAGVFVDSDHPLQHAELALRVVPGEYVHKLVSAVSSAARQVRNENMTVGSAIPAAEEQAKVAQLHQRIGAVIETTESLAATNALASAKAKHLLAEVQRRATTIQRAFSSTGLDSTLDDPDGFFDPRDIDVLFESNVVSSEIAWRLRDVARDLSLQAEALVSDEAQLLQPLITLLDGERPVARDVSVPS